MKAIIHFLSCILPLFALANVASAEPLTQKYAVEPKGSGSFLLRTETAGEWEMQMRFAVFFSATDPKMELRGSAGDVTYNVVSWFNKALEQKSETVEKVQDSNSVGDGFDPRILRGSNAFRTSDLFQAAPHVAVASNAVTKQGERWI
ncbi:MAG: hypothetical protein ACKO2G_09330 [Verrucomicrobiales bacterium]